MNLLTFLSMLGSHYLVPNFVTSPINRQDIMIGCYEPGECTEAYTVGIASAIAPEDCNNYCNATEQCQHWTHYSDMSVCFAHKTCTEFNATTCSDCISGDRGCEENIFCNVSGQCQGQGSDPSVLDIVSNVNTAADCIELCQDQPLCLFWTHDTSNRLCERFEDCGSLNDCPTCVSGSVDCDPLDFLKCDEAGQCVGIVAGLDSASSVDECIAECWNRADCIYWTYDSDTNFCEMFQTCDEISVDVCGHCVSGEKDCYLIDE